MIPQVSGPTIGQIEIVQYPSFDFRLGDNQIVGNVDGLEAIQQTVFHIWHTERYAYPIYGRNYGIELQKYIGRSFGYLKDTIQKTLDEALLQDDRIINVKVTNVTKSDKSSALIEYTVTSDRGTFAMEGEVDI